MTSFAKTTPQQCKCLRGGEMRTMNAIDLVRGDVVFIKSGDTCPADLRMIKVDNLKVDNSSLTGESKSQKRTIKCTDPDRPLETANLSSSRPMPSRARAPASSSVLGTPP